MEMSFIRKKINVKFPLYLLRSKTYREMIFHSSFFHILRLNSNSELLDHVLCLHFGFASSLDDFISFAE